MDTRQTCLAVLTSTHNLCFEQKYENYQNFLSENFHFSVIKFSVYLNRHVFVMATELIGLLRCQFLTAHDKLYNVLFSSKVSIPLPDTDI